MPYIGKMKNEMMSGLVCNCGHDYMCHSPNGNECCECSCTATRASIVSTFVNQSSTPLSPEACEGIGCNIIHWNPKYNGGFFEYYLPVKGDGRGPYDVRLSVRFGEHPDHPVRVYLIGPSSMFVLDYIVTIEDFVTMYRFVTGKRPNTRLETDAADGAAQPC